ncbi:hypothetical protein F2Q69_00046989 [Brassica cretica]|uniref:DUF7792 domain-containing protein n=1 Tax=Brassica cretica TaxID=69181 RepID=A0A8S9PRX9_BRACR|nr:hypothetical protein F2Q69_00046989 [Brassica cretica]
MRQECVELKAKTEKLAGLLRQVARASSDLYERSTHRIIDDTEQILDQTFSLVRKCRANDIMKHVFTIISSTASARCLLSWRTLSVTFLGSSVSPLPLRITVTLVTLVFLLSPPTSRTDHLPHLGAYCSSP